MDKTLTDKHEQLVRKLKEMGSVLVAFSGGVDSSLLLAVACDTLNSDVVAATIHSPVHPQEELERAEKVAELLGAEHLTIHSHEMEDPLFTSNPPERCYYCKHSRFAKLVDIATREGIAEVIDGTQVDDLEESRPGIQATKELGVRSPLAECGFSKYDVRVLSRQRDLPTWNNPPVTCLATRIPFGEELTRGKLAIVNQAEAFLRSMGLYDVRLRFMGKNAARIEVSPSCLSTMVSDSVRDRILSFMKELGFTYTTVDLQGYRSGSMDEALV